MLYTPENLWLEAENASFPLGYLLCKGTLQFVFGGCRCLLDDLDLGCHVWFFGSGIVYPGYLGGPYVMPPILSCFLS